MPYKLVGDCVYKGDEKLKCYEGKDAHEKALAYFRALKVSVRDSAIPELSLYISKVSVDKGKGGVMRWRAVASDTSPDLYDEQMSKDLYDDFIARINQGSTVPTPFDVVLGKSEHWSGGMPYLSISHYKSGTDMKNVPGMPDKIYRDGDKLKATGILHDNPLGRAVFKSLCDDLYSEKAKTEGKIRISIGFLDLAHVHKSEGKSPDFVFERKSLDEVCPMCQSGVGNKIYTKGQLVHLALTRVPVNPRTDMEVSKSMIETKKQDAESIIGKELSDTLEEKSLLASYLITKSEGDTIEEKADMKIGLPGQEPGTGYPVGSGSADSAEMMEKKAEDIDGDDDDKKKRTATTPDAREVVKAKVASDKKSEELTYEEEDEQKREERRNRPAGEKSLMNKSFEALEAKVMELKSQGVPAETALREIQPMFEALGSEIKKSLQPELTQSQTSANTEIAELTSVVKSLAETVQTLQQAMTTKIATIEAQVATKSKVSDVPAPRSLTAANLTNQPVRQLSQIEQLAYKSTFQR